MTSPPRTTRQSPIPPTPLPPTPISPHGASGLHQQYRDLLRARVLETASAAAAEHGWGRVRIVDLARVSGISRSALARVFGDKDGVAAALVAHEADHLIARVGQALAEAADLEAGLLAALRVAVGARECHPFLATVLDAEHGDVELLPLLTTGSAPIIARARLTLTTVLRSRRPRLATAVLDDAVDIVVRATLSHLTAPDPDPGAAVARLHRLACRLLDVATTPP
jgi:AcrR family transcriptional regulator